MTSDAHRTAVTRLRSAAPPFVIVALAAGYLSVDLSEHLVEPVAGLVPPLAYAGILVLQASALVLRHRAPVFAFSTVVFLDAVLLATSGGELGIGALAVMIGTYTLIRSGDLRARYTVVTVGAVVTATVSGVSMGIAATFPPVGVIVVALARSALQYLVPAAIAEFLLARERLVQALRDRAEFAERERVRSVEREIAKVRTAMARELHDIAAHHLSGIIVGAQAAAALVGTDPQRTREMLQTVQQDARSTLTDLRRTVGLLRSDDDSEAGATGQPAPLPSLARVADLVDAARGRGQQVEFGIEGEPMMPGPLAETAGYRMVQESLANAARHAPGASSRVHIDYLPEGVRLTVDNDPVASGQVTLLRSDRGYGIAGMEERAGLVGGLLTTGFQPDGGWRNTLELPREKDRSTT